MCAQNVFKLCDELLVLLVLPNSNLGVTMSIICQCSLKVEPIDFTKSYIGARI